MVISHNMASLNAYRQYGIVNTGKAKTTEKLSSGYKINRAADDAAGLTISEKMRAQIRGLNQGANNIQDGISFLQVADGAMEQIHDMLHRVSELAIQASNETNTAEDRKALDSEVQNIKTEINRINSTTEFNTKPVFFEEGSTTVSQTPTANSRFFEVMGNNATRTGYMQEPIPSAYLRSINHTEAHNIEGTNPFTGVHIDFGSVVNGGNISSLSGTQFYVNCCTDCCATVVNFKDEVGTSISNDVPSVNVRKVINIGLKKTDTEYYDNASEFCQSIVDSLRNISGHVEFANDGDKLFIYDVDPNEWSEASMRSAYFCDTSNFYNPGTMVQSGLWIQMSGNKDDGVYISTGNVGTASLGIEDVKLDPIEEAKKTIERTKAALSKASRIRSNIGAQQNRLEHAYRIDQNSSENTQKAESQIRDADMAMEMVEYSKNNILVQASQAMLAQANQNRQGILSLLQ